LYEPCIKVITRMIIIIIIIIIIITENMLFRTRVVCIRKTGSLNCFTLTLRLLMSYIYGAPSKARNANVVYIWT